MKFKPLTFVELEESCIQYRNTGRSLDLKERYVNKMLADSIYLIQDDLWNEASSDWDVNQPILVFTSVTRDPDYQYKLVKRNRPHNIPTAKPGFSGHQYGVSVDIALRETFVNLNKAGYTFTLQTFKEYLAGFGMRGISSEAWHHNVLTSDEDTVSSWRDREYGDNWKNLSDKDKEELLDSLSISGKTFKTKVKSFQRKYKECISVDGVMGPVTTQIAWCIWAHENAIIEPYS